MGLLNAQNELRNRETAKLSISVLMSQPYYAHSPFLHDIVPNRKSNLLLLYASNAGKKNNY